MGVTISKITAGDGYKYCTEQVVKGDEYRSGMSIAQYYGASGNPQGRWIGSGVRDLQAIYSLKETIGETYMGAMYGHGVHPEVLQLVAEGRGDDAVLGKKWATYSDDRKAVAGYVTFSAMKSVYADKWARGRNPDYPTTPMTQGADCTNYASRVLHAGGFKEEPAPTNKNDKSTRYWASYKNVELPSASYGPPIEVSGPTHPTRSWNNADTLYHRLVDTNRGKVVGRVKGQKSQVKGQKNGKNNLSPSQHGLQPGDLIFYENSQSHKMTHVAVYMGTKNGVDIVNQHSSYQDKHDYHDNWQTDSPDSKVYYPGEPRR